MNIIALLQDFRSLIHEDAQVRDWCQIHHGEGVQSCIGMDARNPPTTKAPLVHLFPGEKETGFGVDPKRYLIGVTCSIHDDSPAVLVHEGAEEYEAVALVEEFRQLVLAAIMRTTIDGLIFQSIHTEYETIEFFPEFAATMAITVEQPREFRDDPYE